MMHGCNMANLEMQSKDQAYYPTYADECMQPGGHEQKDGSIFYWGGTVFSEFYIGACCKTLEEAKKHYEEYVAFSGPIDNSWEDSTHCIHHTLGKLELMRIYYLLGEIEKGDAILKDMKASEIQWRSLKGI